MTRLLAAPGDVLSTLLPYGIGAFALLAVALWAGQQFFGSVLKQLGSRASDALMSRLGGGRFLSATQLRRYCRAVEDNYATHPLGFAKGAVIKIREVYVPLQHEGNGGRQDIYERVRAESRSIVLGAAGAGKSLLLKNSMLRWASGAQSGYCRFVPVLVQLHRCNANELNLVDLVTEELNRARPLRAKKSDADRRFTEKALDEGRLRLLFDGLDEVGRDDQTRVMQELRVLARDYPKCQMVVTCRGAVYEGQLSPEFVHEVSVADFDDAGIRRLLGNWPGLDANGVNQLFATLRKNPSLMRLARSPLLLTMIAYLHTEIFAEASRTLPTSRAAFYERAIAHLLARDSNLGRGGRPLAIYDVSDKLAVLQRVALTLQESPPGEADRLTISKVRLRSVVHELLSDLNRESKDIDPLLAEIIDRSQLLVVLDKSESRYTFAHLTMQEYLAASELADDPERLLERYRADPNAWRETVKLWCGVSKRDCTHLVDQVFASDELRHKILAFECLAEAGRIRQDFVDQIINYFVGRLGEPGQDGAAIVAAFGAVAADSSPRSRKILDTLSGIARDSSQGAARSSAMRALSASGQLVAAETLAPLAVDSEDARAALREMGELALPVLVFSAGAGNSWAVDDLAVIGTPAAAEALAALLWSEDLNIATRVAWLLAELLCSPDVEEGLRRFQVRIPPNAASYDWVWEPFNEGKPDMLAAAAGRIAYLIDTGPEDAIPDSLTEIDTRLGLPICAFGSAREIARSSAVGSHELPDPTVDDLVHLVGNQMNVETHRHGGYYGLQEVIRLAARSDTPTLEMYALRDVLLSRVGISDRYRQCVRVLSWPVQALLLSELYAPSFFSGRYSGRDFTREDWRTVRNKPREPRLLRAVAGVGIMGGLLAVSAIAIYRDILTVGGSSPVGPAWLSWASLTGFALVLLLFVLFAANEFLDLFEPVVDILDDLIDVFVDSKVGAVAGAIVASAFCGHSLFFAALTAAAWVGWLVTIAVVVGLVGLVLVTSRIATRRERAIANPLRTFLEADARPLLGRASVIAN